MERQTDEGQTYSLLPFYKIPRGPTFSRGEGVHLLIPIETWGTCDFPGGRGLDTFPLSLDPRM